MSILISSSANSLIIQSTNPAIPSDILLDRNESSLNPVGCVLPYAGATAPFGWLLCDGSEISCDTYSRLFNVIGTNYGVATQPNYFVLPDMRDRMPIGKWNQSMGETGGANTVTLSINELPSHSHSGITAQTGSHTHTVTVDQNGSHNHTVNDPGHKHDLVTINDDHNNSGGNPPGFIADSAGSMTWTNVVQFAQTGITIGVNGDHTHNASMSANGDHAHSFVTNTTGNGNAFSVQNKYIVLNYIIRF